MSRSGGPSGRTIARLAGLFLIVLGVFILQSLYQNLLRIRDARAGVGARGASGFAGAPLTRAERERRRLRAERERREREGTADGASRRGPSLPDGFVESPIPVVPSTTGPSGPSPTAPERETGAAPAPEAGTGPAPRG